MSLSLQDLTPARNLRHFEEEYMKYESCCLALLSKEVIGQVHLNFSAYSYLQLFNKVSYNTFKAQLKYYHCKYNKSEQKSIQINSKNCISVWYQLYREVNVNLFENLSFGKVMLFLLFYLIRNK